MMDAEFRWFQECDALYFEERREGVIPGVKIVAERKAAAKALLDWKKIYEQRTGLSFDWPREAVVHARVNYLSKVLS
jgi:hypothetical protein